VPLGSTVYLVASLNMIVVFLWFYFELLFLTNNCTTRYPSWGDVDIIFSELVKATYDVRGSSTLCYASVYTRLAAQRMGQRQRRLTASIYTA
jgi:hypothetical protein